MATVEELNSIRGRGIVPVTLFGADGTSSGVGASAGSISLALSNPGQLTRVGINITTATTTTVVALTAAQTIRVYRMMLNFAAAQTLDIRSSTGGTLVGAAMTFGVGGNIVLDLSGDPWFITVAGESLQFVTTTTGAVTGDVWYIKSV